MKKVLFHNKQLADIDEMLALGQYQMENIYEIIELLLFSGFTVVSAFVILERNIVDGGVRLGISLGTQNGKIIQVNSEQAINIISDIGGWGTAQAAHDTHPRYSIVCIKYDTIDKEIKDKWFIDATATPPVEYQQAVNTVTENYYEIVVIHGTAAASPTIPDIPAGYEKLAEILVPNSATIITNSDITNTSPSPVDNLEEHINTGNPHSNSAAKDGNYASLRAQATTKADVGLGNVTDNLQETKTDADLHKLSYEPHIPFGGTSTNSDNNYSISSPSIGSLAEGMAICFKCNTDSSGATTLNWDGKGAKAIKKANGTDVINLKSGGIYTLRYDGTNFILQGEGASGDAIASDLLSGKTATVDAGEITGTMPNHSALSVIPGKESQNFSEGYYSDITVQKNQTVVASDTLQLSITTFFNSLQQNSYITHRRIVIGIPGIVRIKFKLRVITEGATAYFQIRKGESTPYTVISTDTTTSTSYVEFYYDIAVQSGDIYSFWAKSSHSGMYISYGEVMLCYDIEDITPEQLIQTTEFD